MLPGHVIPGQAPSIDRPHDFWPAQAIVGGRRYSPSVNERSNRLLQEIEAGALDSKVRIGDLLRKAIALGGQAGSAELRDWAARELRGYTSDDELPEYRKIVAPLHLDMMNMRWIKKGHQISPSELPEFARESINEVKLHMGIAEIEKLAIQDDEDDVVKLQPALAAELVYYLNAHHVQNGRIERLYWAVSPVALEGVVEHVRTAVAVMVAEINATMPDDAQTPPAEAATNAIHFVVTGKRNKISFAAAHGGSTVETLPPGAEQKPRHWLRIAAAVLLGLVAIAGVIFALMQVQGWHDRPLTSETAGRGPGHNYS